MITLQEAERLLDRLNEDAGPAEYQPDYHVGASHLLTRLVSAGAFRHLDAQEFRAALMLEGITANTAEYVLRVARKLGVCA